MAWSLKGVAQPAEDLVAEQGLWVHRGVRCRVGGRVRPGGVGIAVRAAPVDRVGRGVAPRGDGPEPVVGEDVTGVVDDNVEYDEEPSRVRSIDKIPQLGIRIGRIGAGTGRVAQKRGLPVKFWMPYPW